MLKSMSPTPTPFPTPFDPSSQLVHELRLSPDAEAWLRTLSPGLFNNYQDIQTMWNYPLTQFSLTLVKDPQFRAAVSEIHAKQAGQQLFAYEALLVLVIWVFRAWKLSKVSTWLARIWAQAWIAAVLGCVGLFLVPYLVWGEPFRLILGQVAKALFRHFFA